ncbi:hypothetical protein F503_01084 [Ophiostoma piceae UAMH 11346]|uniref:Uncharacterized protein n=1 Tax=Ophiostoma piceae (strain UAMH 11346) TaxID=1262450 RepID=S3C8N6_OPHP1|nr:hypothetical protein F503_01084 [Ophiostoma piceae UAMH 11346]
MTDWSDIFEKRLQTVLGDDGSSARKAAALDLTPPTTAHRGLGHQQQRSKDPTSAFFESMRRQSGGGQVSRYDNGGPVMTPAAQTSAASPAFAVDTEQPIKRLQGKATSNSTRVLSRCYPLTTSESYSNRARDLHGEAMKRLDDVQETLEAELAFMAQQAEQFLSAAAEKQAHISRPAEKWVVKIQTREGPPKSAMKTTSHKDERVVDRIATIRETADALKSDLARLWEQWNVAHKEASTILQAITSDAPTTAHSDADEIMAKAEKELTAAAAEAMKEMKENEKTFKKLIYAEECKIAQTMLSRQSKYD